MRVRFLLVLGLSAAAAASCQWLAHIDTKEATTTGASSGGGADASDDGPPPDAANEVDGGPGCADGTREGFDQSEFPTIAACSASWAGQSMRTKATGVPCGNDLGPCNTPSDACAPGWHVCLLHGYAADLTSRIHAADCHPATTKLAHRFIAAANQNGGLSCDAPLPCDKDDGYSIAVCCGPSLDPSLGCWVSQSSCVFDKAQTPFGLGQCGAVDSNAPDGVLCCMDPEIMQ